MPYALYVFLLVVYTLTVARALLPQEIELTTPFGSLKGEVRDHYTAHEGIPYAEPPVGDRRFEPPIPYKTNVSKSFSLNMAGNQNGSNE